MSFSDNQWQPRGGRGKNRGNRYRGGGGRYRFSYNNPSWPRYSNGMHQRSFPPQNYTSFNNRQKQPYMYKRPPSPLPGTEEYTQRNIQQTSDLIKKHILGGEETDLNVFANTFNPVKEIETQVIDSTDEDNSQKDVPHKSNTKIKTSNRKQFTDIDMNDIHDKIIKHISNLSIHKKMNIVNQGSAGYDYAINQIQRKKKIELMRALRNMSSNKSQNEADCEVINSIIPDIGIKIEELPLEFIAKLSSTLDVEFESQWSSSDDCMKQIEEFNPDETPPILTEEVDYGREKYRNESGRFKDIKVSDGDEVLVSAVSDSPSIRVELDMLCEMPRNSYLSPRRDTKTPFCNTLLDNNFDNCLETKSEKDVDIDPMTEYNEEPPVLHPEKIKLVSKWLQTNEITANDDSILKAELIDKQIQNEQHSPHSQESNVKQNIKNCPTKNPNEPLKPFRIPKKSNESKHKKEQEQKDDKYERRKCKKSKYSRHSKEKAPPTKTSDMKTAESTQVAPEIVSEPLQVKDKNICQTSVVAVVDDIASVNDVDICGESTLTASTRFNESNISKYEAEAGNNDNLIKATPVSDSSVISENKDDTLIRKPWKSLGERKQLPIHIQVLDTSQEQSDGTHKSKSKYEKSDMQHKSYSTEAAVQTDIISMLKLDESIPEQGSMSKSAFHRIILTKIKSIDVSIDKLNMLRMTLSDLLYPESEEETVANPSSIAETKCNLLPPDGNSTAVVINETLSLESVNSVKQEDVEITEAPIAENSLNKKKSAKKRRNPIDVLLNHLPVTSTSEESLPISRKRKCTLGIVYEPQSEASASRSKPKRTSNTSKSKKPTEPATIIKEELSTEESTNHKSKTRTCSNLVNPEHTKESDWKQAMNVQSIKVEPMDSNVSDLESPPPTNKKAATKRRKHTLPTRKKKVVRVQSSTGDKDVSSKKNVSTTPSGTDVIGEPKECLSGCSKVLSVKLPRYSVSDLTVIKERLKSVSPTTEHSECNSSSVLPTEVLTVHESAPIDVVFSGWDGTILVIKVVENAVIACSDNGKVYFYNDNSSDLQHEIQLSDKHLTSVYAELSTNTLFIGSLDESLYILNYMTKELKDRVYVENAVQCIDGNWGFLFIGSQNGNLSRYSIKKKKIVEAISISESAVLVVHTSQEGARRVVLTATRHTRVTVRDAMTGLLLRNLECEMTPSIYSINCYKSDVYCGADKNVLVFNFQSGKLTHTFDKTGGSGVVCISRFKHILFFGCYSGNIHIYDGNKHKLIETLKAPDGLLLTMDIQNCNKLIVGTKRCCKVLQLPTSVIRELT